MEVGGQEQQNIHIYFESDGYVFPNMLQLVEDFNDRFMIGMDNAHAKGWLGSAYIERVERFRELLSQFTNNTADKVAYKNAIQIFKLPVID